MGQHDMNDSQQAHRHSRKRSNKSKSPTDWIGRDFCQANVQAHREIRGNSTSPRAHAFHAMEDRHEHKRHTTEWDMEKTAKMAWEYKKTNAKGSGMHTQGPKHHPFVPSQYKRGGPMIKGFKGCGLVVGGKRSILGFLLRLVLGKMPFWDGISPKRGK